MTRSMRGRVLVKIVDKDSGSVIVGATEKVRTVVAVGADVCDLDVGDVIPHEFPATKIITPEWGAVYSVKVDDIQAVLRDHT